MGKPYTTFTFKEKVYSLVNTEYDVLTEYEGSHKYIKMRHNCKKCNNSEYFVKPYHFINGKRCPVCAKQDAIERITEKNGLKKAQESKKLNEEKFVNNLSKKYSNEFLLISNYVDYETKVLFRHNCGTCNFSTFLKTPHDLLSKGSCPNCGKNKKIKHLKEIENYRVSMAKEKLSKSIDTIKTELFNLRGNEYTILSDTYINNKTKLLVRHNCDTCNNNEFLISYNKLLKLKYCPICNPMKKKDTNTFKLEVSNQLYGDEYEIRSEYINNSTKIKFFHKTCNHEFEMRPTNFLKRR